MPEIQIRSAAALDIPALINLDHTYTTDYAWQIDVQQPEEGELQVHLHRVRLPRSAQVAYPHSPLTLQDDWQQRPGLLVASLQDASSRQIVGYVSLAKDNLPTIAWITDLVVTPYLRQRGIGAALILAAREWAAGQGYQRLILAVQPKNHPAISLAYKLGFSFCGYHEHHFPNQEIALFFTRLLH